MLMMDVGNWCLMINIVKIVKQCCMRLLVFCIGKKKNGKLINKRAACKIILLKTEISEERTAQLMKKNMVIYLMKN